MKPKWITTLIIAAGAAGLLAAFALPGARAELTAQPPDAPVVRVADAQPVSTAHRRSFAGQLRAVQRAQLAFTISGRLASRPAALGQRLDAGQTIGRLDRRGLRNAVASSAAALAEVEARLDQRKRDDRRAGALVQSGAISTGDREDAQSAVASLSASRDGAVASLHEARRQLGEATLKAPFAGVVTEVLAEPGEYVVAGRTVAVLSGSNDLELELEVPETVAAQLLVGEDARVHLPLVGRDVAAQVTAVGHAVPARGRLFPIVVRLLDREGLIPGMTAELHLEVGAARSPALSVPVEAVVNPGGMHPLVFRVDRAHAQSVEVEVLDVVDGRAIVRGELHAGDAIVIAGHGGLVPGEAVEVAA